MPIAIYFRVSSESTWLERSPKLPTDNFLAIFFPFTMVAGEYNIIHPILAEY